MLKIIKLLNMSTFKKNKDNNKVVRFDINSNNLEFIKKSRKLKSKKLFKF